MTIPKWPPRTHPPVSDSAIERVLHERMVWLREELPRHDRAVIAGLALSLVPIPPVAFAGLLLGVANCVLTKRGRIDRRDMRLAQLSVACGLIMTLVTTALAVMLVRAVFHSLAEFTPFQDFLRSPLSHILHAWPGSRGAISSSTQIRWSP
jgi:hypothetical protein